MDKCPTKTSYKVVLESEFENDFESCAESLGSLSLSNTKFSGGTVCAAILIQMQNLK